MGGRLAVYFQYDLADYLEILKPNGNNIIKFTNASVAIIDTLNGSGADCFLPKHSFDLPLNRENLFYERAVHYNYTYQVCGMDSDWCDSTVVELGHDPALAKMQSPVRAISKYIWNAKQVMM